MGFLDRVSKTIDTVRDVAAKIDRSSTPAGEQPPTAAPTAPPASPASAWDPSQASGLDSADPLRWLTPAEVEETTGVAVGPPTTVDTAETFGARFTAPTGAVIELHSLSEDVLLRGVSPTDWIDQQAARFGMAQPLPTFGDYSMTASNGPDDCACFVMCADACFAAYATGPDVRNRRVPEMLLRRLFDWPE